VKTELQKKIGPGHGLSSSRGFFLELAGTILIFFNRLRALMQHESKECYVSLRVGIFLAHVPN
jgi:hypothetical protein